MSTLLIGLTGLARSGKSTAAEHLVANYNLEHYAFADPLRDGLMAIFNLIPSDFEGDRKEQTLNWLGRSPRELMQSMGTEWARNTVHPDVWVKLAEQNLDYITRAMSPVTGFVISDVRFENEADFIRQRGGTLIHISRHDTPRINPHISEAGIALRLDDLVLHNNGTLETFLHSLDEVARAVIKHQRHSTWPAA